MTAHPRVPHAPSALAALLALLAAACVGPGAARAPQAAVSGESAASEAAAADPAAAREAAVERLLAISERDSRVGEHLEQLTRQFGPRLTSSSNLERAERWCRERFASFGLAARLEPWGTFPVGFDRGPWSGGMVAPERVDYDFTSDAWTPGTDGPRRGAAVLLPADEDELAAREAAFAGAWLVQPAWGRGERPEGKFLERVEERAAERGAAGVVRPSRSDELVHTGGRHRVEWDALPRLAKVVLRRDQHADLVRRLEAGEAVELELAIDNRFRQGPVQLHNVVADLVGSERPDEYVVVNGHLDSWDGAQGVVDNGTGVATTLEAARLLALAGARPKRTIRFVLWSGEEQGLLGSRAYVEQNAELLPRVSAVLTHDGGTNHVSGITVTPQMLAQMEQACAEVLDLDPQMPFEIGTSDGLPARGGSDHVSFLRAGVPGFFWRQSGRSDYDRHHHTQHDTLDAAIPEYQEHSAKVIALVAWGLADLDGLLDRTNMEAPEPRRMGVQLDGATVREVTGRGKAAEAGWQPGDVIVSIDGEAVSDQREVVRALQAGGPRKVVVLRRGAETLETVLDYSDDPGEARRAELRARRAERARERDAQGGDGDGAGDG